MNYIRGRQGGAHRASPINKPPPSDIRIRSGALDCVTVTGKFKDGTGNIVSLSIDEYRSFAIFLYFFFFPRILTIQSSTFDKRILYSTTSQEIDRHL